MARSSSERYKVHKILFLGRTLGNWLVGKKNTLPFWGKTPSSFWQKVAVIYQNRAVVCPKEGMVLKACVSQRQYIRTALKGNF